MFLHVARRPHHIDCDSTYIMQGVVIRATICEKGLVVLVNKACTSVCGELGFISRSFGRLCPIFFLHRGMLNLELGWATTRVVFGLRGCSYERRIQATGPLPVPHQRSGRDQIYSRCKNYGDLDLARQAELPLCDTTTRDILIR